MITQDLNALRYCSAMFELGEVFNTRYGLLDSIVLLTIFEHPESGKADINEIHYGDREKSKSSLDRPVSRLLDAGLIEKISRDDISTKLGKCKTVYRVSKKGHKFLSSCA